ncbi:hypothetical protein [Aquimarina mytili]|uniref:Uncharacterized protein n=2 Tax=Aquimarina mytili TaxID=874423 RepID=A0A936ZSU3_9FLAO|nr:hypothetical protein [Aquimarina mytili]MBL0684782.1 hypothetical protein [Aquimarina mytili]
MKKYNITYHHFSITKWFFLIAVLFCLQGFSNYNSPEVKQITSELTIQPKQKQPFSTVCYQKKLKQHIDHCFVDKKHNTLAQLHTHSARTTINTYLLTFSFLDRLIIRISYPDEEESFQLV